MRLLLSVTSLSPTLHLHCCYFSPDLPHCPTPQKRTKASSNPFFAPPPSTTPYPVSKSLTSTSKPTTHTKHTNAHLPLPLHPPPPPPHPPSRPRLRPHPRRRPKPHRHTHPSRPAIIPPQDPRDREQQRDEFDQGWALCYGLS